MVAHCKPCGDGTTDLASPPGVSVAAPSCPVAPPLLPNPEVSDVNPLQFSWQLTRRDWRAGELRLLLAALVVAVAALASVGVFVDRMRAALSVEAR